MRRWIVVAGLSVALAASTAATNSSAAPVGIPGWSDSSAGDDLPAQLLGDAASTAFDGATGQVVLAGGTAGTWTWDGRTWTQAHPPTSPIPRYRPVLGYDDATKQVVMFGGDVVPGVPSSPQDEWDDTWTWNGRTWTDHHPLHHPVSGGTCAGYDEATGQYLMLGDSPTAGHAGVWTWSGSDWTELSTVSVQNDFGECSMVYDPDLHTEVLLGSTGLALQVLLSWDGHEWNVFQNNLPWASTWASHDALVYYPDTGELLALVDAFNSAAPTTQQRPRISCAKNG